LFFYNWLQVKRTRPLNPTSKEEEVL